MDLLNFKGRNIPPHVPVPTDGGAQTSLAGSLLSGKTWEIEINLTVAGGCVYFNRDSKGVRCDTQKIKQSEENK